MNPLRLITVKPKIEVVTLDDGAIVRTLRGHHVSDAVRLGPNQVHFRVIHADGSSDDAGIVRNLLTTVGRDLLAAAMGHGTIKEGAFTASSATSGTPAGGGMSASQYKGWKVYCPVTGLTTPPVYGNIGDNSTTVLTVDKWWNAADGTATTPASTNGYMVVPAFDARFIGLSESASAPAAGDTTLASEITTGGCNRALGAYAHTPGAATYTISKSFSVTSSFPAIQKGALFTAADTTAAGVMCFETEPAADANVINGDTLAVTWTVTLSG
jgi:hypothetical protein